MKFRLTGLISLLLLILFLPGCEAIAGIFKAGIWTGIIAVIIVIALIIWAVKAMMNRD